MTLRAARGGSFLVQFHGWRGFGRDRGLFWLEYRAGFLTVAFDKRLLGDRLRRLADLYHQITEKVR